jgi:hypothetical protein
LKLSFRLFGIVGIAVCLLVSAVSIAQETVQTDQDESKEVVASGIGSIIGGDIAHARDDAVEEALRNAIEQVLGLMVESQTLVENYQLLEDKIFTKTKGYVQNYDIIKENKRNEQMYEVTVRATLKMANIKDDLEGIKTLITRKNTPRMMVLIEERNIGETVGSHYFETDMNTAETALMEAFMAKSFRFVDQATIRKNLDKEMSAAILEGNAAQAASLGRTVGAEVVLTGKALAKATEIEAFGTKIRSQQATVNGRAIRSDTGDIIAIGSAQGKFSHIDDVAGGTKAIQQACEKLSEDLMNKILEKWQTDVSSGTIITLKVQGITDYAQLSKFKASLKYYVRGLTSVTQRDWSGEYATLEIEMKGNSDDLAQRLSNKNIEGIQVTVVGMSQNSVTVKLAQ